MEPVSSILANLGQPPRTRAGKALERQQVSNLIDEGKKSPDTHIRSDVALAEGWTMKDPPPEPSYCQFCGRTLYHYGLKDFLTKSKSVILWFKEPERCTCPDAQRYWDNLAAQKAAEEEARQKQEAAERMQKKITRLLKDSGMRGRFANRTFERFEVNDLNRRAFQKCKRYADSFAIMLPTKDARGNVIPPQKERNGLFLTGGYGTGKTHLVSAIANQLMYGGTPVICMTMIDLLAKVKSSFDRDEAATEAEIMKLYEEIPLLIIDDIGSEQPTEWGITHIYQIINARYEAYMPTIVTTNYTGDELVRRMTPSINGRMGDAKNAEKTIDRLREMCAGLEMYWDSYRTK